MSNQNWASSQANSAATAEIAAQAVTDAAALAAQEVIDAAARLVISKDTVQYVFGQIAFDTAAVDAGVAIGTIPANSYISRLQVKVTTAFNAGTTNVLTVGKTGTLNAYVAAGDVDESSATVQTATTGIGSIGGSLVTVLAAYTQTGTAASTGAADVLIEYINTAGTSGTP